MHPQKIVALDVEGVLIPEVWVNLARHTGIDALSRTTRDEPDYNVLMNYRLEILEREGVSMSQLREVLAETGIRLAIEGWPGCNALCCNPESYRAFLQQMNSPYIGINYDPSHLIRMGIDPLRFIKEFGSQVVHIHGKDTLIDQERLYDIGHEQDAVFAENFAWGGATWRYTIPGKGYAPWTEILNEAVAANYDGYVSIELEDVDYNGTLEGEQRGFISSRDFLKTV